MLEAQGRDAASIAIELIRSAVAILTAAGPAHEKVSEAREEIEKLDRLGLREALVDGRAHEQEEVRKWVGAHWEQLAPRAIRGNKRAPMSEYTRESPRNK